MDSHLDFTLASGVDADGALGSRRLSVRLEFDLAVELQP